MSARSRAADDFAGRVRDLIGARIRWIRRDQELSQEALAFRASIHRTQVTMIEHGLRMSGPDTLIKIAGGLGVPFPVLTEGVVWEIDDGGIGRPVWADVDDPRRPAAAAHRPIGLRAGSPNAPAGGVR
ncbi:MAG TPA: helix-turn-helix transcriptional regulator [Solirubrobacterales bacterium]